MSKAAGRTVCRCSECGDIFPAERYLDAHRSQAHRSGRPEEGLRSVTDLSTGDKITWPGRKSSCEVLDATGDVVTVEGPLGAEILLIDIDGGFRRVHRGKRINHIEVVSDE